MRTIELARSHIMTFVVIATAFTVSLLITSKPPLVFFFIGLVIAFYVAWFHPEWFLGAVALAFLWTPYKDFLGFPLYNYLAAFLLLVFFLKAAMKATRLGSPGGWEVFVISGVFVVWAFFVESLNNGISSDIVRNTARLILFSMIAFLTWDTVKSSKSLRIFIYLVLFGAGVSGFVGIMQVVGVDFFWDLRNWIDPVRPELLDRSKAMGLAYYSIPFSYQMCSVVPLGLGMLIASRDKAEKIFLALVTGIVFLGLILSFVRAAVFGAVFSVVAVIALKRKLRNKVLLALLLAVFSVTIFYFQEALRPVRAYSDTSLIDKLRNQAIAVRSLISNPLGVGKEKYFEEEIKEHYVYVSGASESSISPHNQFLNVAAYYGFPGLLLLVILYKKLFGYASSLRKSLQNPFLWHVNLGIMGSLISYLITSLFHNAGLFVGDPWQWFFIGMLLSLLNIQSDKNVCQKLAS